MTYRAPSLRTFVVTAALALVASAVFMVSRPVSLQVNGLPVMSDVPPVTTPNGKTYVPIKAFAHALGAHVIVLPKRMIELVHGDQTLRLQIGSTVAMLDGHVIHLRLAPFIVRARAMVALETLTNAFNVSAHYDSQHDRIEVRSNGIVTESPTPSP
ncbi:MAG: copper amine oxidase N-terminal domain-containing protein [Thermoplasmataceae archaeon]